MTVDRSIHRFALDHRSSLLTALFKLATHLGSSAVLLPLLLVVGADGPAGSAAPEALGTAAGDH